jgi:L-iditol 2-dehydrogenase
MKALVKHSEGREGLGLLDVAIPEIGADDVLVEVKATAICGTDLHIRKDHYPVEMPVVIGHEFSGVIEKVGENVSQWKKGDRIIAEGSLENCGRCPLCRSGNANLCINNKYLGIKVDGVFAKYVRIPAKLLHRIPDKISYEEAALAEPAAVAIDALLVKNQIQVGDAVVILGCGPIGLLAGQIAKAAGARQVFITGRESAVRSRFKIAADLKVFDRIVNVEKEDLVAIVRESTEGRGADLIFDSTGSSAGLAQAFQAVCRSGTIVLVGMGDPVLEVPWQEMMREVVKIHFCRGTSFASFQKFCSLAETGRLTLGPMISRKFPLEDWEKAFDSLENRDSLKVLLVP